MMRSKVILADDHQFLLEGILTILKEETYLDIVATVRNGFELMEVVASQNPELVILDLNMPGYDGLKCLQKIKTAYTTTKVLILTNYIQPELVDEVKKLGAEGYLIKNSSAAELIEAIKIILSGGTRYPTSGDLKTTPDDSHFFDEFLKKYQLTKREVQIIRMICKEKSTKQIAIELFLSELTINTHRRNIFRKLDLKNMVGLFNFAQNNQLL